MELSILANYQIRLNQSNTKIHQETVSLLSAAHCLAMMNARHEVNIHEPTRLIVHQVSNWTPVDRWLLPTTNKTIAIYKSRPKRVLQQQFKLWNVTRHMTCYQ